MEYDNNKGKYLITDHKNNPTRNLMDLNPKPWNPDHCDRTLLKSNINDNHKIIRHCQDLFVYKHKKFIHFFSSFV